MIPKSTAPIDSRLADLPCMYSTVTEKSKASGIISATIPAAARSPRKDEQDGRITSGHAVHDQVVEHVLRGDVDQRGPLVEDLHVHPLGEDS